MKGFHYSHIREKVLIHTSNKNENNNVQLFRENLTNVKKKLLYDRIRKKNSNLFNRFFFNVTYID